MAGFFVHGILLPWFWSVHGYLYLESTRRQDGRFYNVYFVPMEAMRRHMGHYLACSFDSFSAILQSWPIERLWWVGCLSEIGHFFNAQLDGDTAILEGRLLPTYARAAVPIAGAVGCSAMSGAPASMREIPWWQDVCQTMDLIYGRPFFEMHIFSDSAIPQHAPVVLYVSNSDYRLHHPGRCMRYFVPASSPDMWQHGARGARKFGDYDEPMWAPEVYRRSRL